MHMTTKTAMENPAIKEAIEKANARKMPLFDGRGVFTFEAYGDPIPEGSLVSFQDPRTGKIISKPDDPRLNKWRLNVRDAAARAMRGRAPVGAHKPLLMGCVFRLSRPEKGKPGHECAPDWPTVGRDEDKLIRAVRDALKGVVYVDDGQICGQLPPGLKRYVRDGERPGVVVRLCPISVAQKDLWEDQ